MGKRLENSIAFPLISMAKTSETDAYRRAADKATKHSRFPPKEKHLLTLLSAASPKQCKLVREILEKRLAVAHSWQIALNTLSLIHRIITADRPHFTTDLNILLNSPDLRNMTQFTDESNKQAALSVGNYALYLLKKFQEDSRSKDDLKKSEDLLKRVRSLQILITLLFDCVPPNGNLVQNPVFQYALDLLLRDCGAIYSEICDCIPKIVDLFFELPGGQNEVGLEIYKTHLQQSGVLIEMQRFVSPYTKLELPVPAMAVVGRGRCMVEIMEEHIISKKEIEARHDSKSSSFRRPTPHPLPEKNE